MGGSNHDKASTYPLHDMGRKRKNVKIRNGRLSRELHRSFIKRWKMASLTKSEICFLCRTDVPTIG